MSTVPKPPLPSLFLVLLLTTTTTHSHATSAHHHSKKQHQHGHPIKHLVILVMENRSFDHMLGWMKRSVNPSIDGLDGSQCNRLSTSDPNSPSLCVSDGARFVDPDPGHSFPEITRQVFGSSPVPDMSGFAEQASSLSADLPAFVMRAFSPEDIPVYAKLVKEFAVFDRWFASAPAPTQPNRLFVYSATSRGTTSNDKLRLLRGFPQRTIFDSLWKDGMDFAVYAGNVPTTLFLRSMRRVGVVAERFHWMGRFAEDAREGRLREVSVIEPRYFDVFGDEADDDHPSHDVGKGQRLVKEVYEALRGGPQWNETALVITYDEHGGFYDHVPTPYKGLPSPDRKVVAPDRFRFDRLGVRVPTIVASPWIRKGTVVHGPNGPTPTSEFEHSSIAATIKKIFNLSSDYLTCRDAWAGTFEHIFTELSSPRTDCPEVLPEPRPMRQNVPDDNRTISEFQSELVQLAAALGGDHHYFLQRVGGQDLGEASKKMTVKEADAYVKQVMSRFFNANKKAMEMGADKSSIISVSSFSDRT